MRNAIRVKSCSSDAHQCQSGDVFVAIDNGTIDGHEEAYAAIENGASAVVVERILPVTVPQYVVEDSRSAFGRICHALSGSPTDFLKTIGITGTYGKTVTELLTVSILEHARQAVGIVGSLGCCDGMTTELRSATTPKSAELMNWLARMRANGCSHAVVEASSEALATKQLSGIGLDGVIMTNVRRDHMQIHGSVKNYRAAKQQIFNYLKPGGFAVMNADDPTCQKILATLDCPLMTFGMKHPAEVTATLIERCQSEQTFLINAGSDSMPVRTHMIGDHHIQNCLAATCVGLVLGIDLPTIAKGLEAVTEVPARLERIECGQDFGVFVDGASTPDSLLTGLSTLQEVTKGRLICVTGPQDIASIERARMGGILEQFADDCVLTENATPSDSTMNDIHDVLDGFDRPAMAHLLPDRVKAICWALGEAQAGDTVLVVGGRRNAHAKSSVDQERFFDGQVVKYWLQNIGADKASPWIPA